MMNRLNFIVCLILVTTIDIVGCSENIHTESNTQSESTSVPFQTSIAESDKESKTNSRTPEPTTAPEPDIRTINMVAVGNIFPHEPPQVGQAYIGEGKYDFSPSFEFIAPRLLEADLVVADLETVQAGPDITFLGVKGYTGYPTFNSPEELSVALREAGVDIMTLANNHALDRGYQGLLVTIDHIRSLGMRTFGAYKSQEERDEILIEEHNGINIAFIGYTYSTNAIPLPEGKEYCVNLVPFFQEYSALIADIKTARNRGADIVAVFPHWGEEHHLEPYPQYLREVAENIAAAGADVIIGGHPKYTQPIEWFFNENDDKSQRASMVIYSQGNFLSNQYYPALPSHFVQYHALMDISFSKDMNTGKAWISDVNYEITWIHRDWRHRILLLEDVFKGDPEDFNLTESKVEELKDWHDRVVNALEAYGHTGDKAKALDLHK